VALNVILAFFVAYIRLVRPGDRVYDFDRLVVHPEQAEDFYGVDDVTYPRGRALRVWMLDRTLLQALWGTQDETIYTHHCRLHGLWEVDEFRASRRAHRDAIDQVVEHLGNLPFVGPSLVVPGIDPGLMAQVPELEILGPPQVTNDAQPAAVLVAEVYPCHGVDITFAVQQRVVRTRLV